MSWFANALDHTAEFPHPESLESFCSHIDEQWIEEALAATGVATLRRRRLPAERVVWLVIGMGMMRDRPMREVVSSLDLALPKADGRTGVAPSAVIQARTRLGPEPMRWLFERCGDQWAHEQARKSSWRGLALYAVDGTTLRVPDSDENRDFFGSTTNKARGDGGSPLVRLVVLMALRSHLIAAARFGPYKKKGEHTYAKELWEELPEKSLLVVDKGFYSTKLFMLLQKDETRHWLIRAKSDTAWTVLKQWSPKDLLVELKVGKVARSEDPSLPETFTARAIRYDRPGSAGEQWLLTSLLDRKKYPKAEIVELYHERWEIELGYGEIKTKMLARYETLRSKSVDGINQELWGILLAFNLVRLEMAEIAVEAKVAASRISFIMALRTIRDEWVFCGIASPGSIPKKLNGMREEVAQFVLPERRRERRFPRAVKRKMSNYPRKAPNTPENRAKRDAGA